MGNAFPPEFKWGVATASYQIEGAAEADGRGASIWDTFSRTPGKVWQGHTGDVACDHYHRYPQDVALMRELGIQSYRFSVAWPRLFPNGGSTPEPRGFAFYDRLVDELLSAGITPMATLYHWDLPQALQDQGGWANRDIAFRFAEYAQQTVAKLGDRIDTWLTLNEPWCVTWLGYMSGVHAPGIQSLESAVAAAHHTALAHGLATRAIRAVSPSARVGIALNMTNYRVDDGTNEELNELAALMDSHVNRWWIDAFLTGKYPENLVSFYGDLLGRVMQSDDASILQVQTDLLGINYYSDSFLSTPTAQDRPMSEGGLFPFSQRSGGAVPQPQTAMGWPITPNGLFDLLVRISRDWPGIGDMSITENGAAFDDVLTPDGFVADHDRVAYLERHIESVGRAIERGVPVSSYHAWSFLDNYEWAEGYNKRFGLVYVDYETQQRIPKLSAEAYRSLILAHAKHKELLQRAAR